MVRRSLAALPLALALVWCAPALAATARVDTVNPGRADSSLELVYQADPGEVNVVNVGLEPDGWYRIHDPGAAIAAGERCEADGDHSVRCFANRVEVRADDMDDDVYGAAGAAIARISGGAGNDALDIPVGDPVPGARLMGGDGNDVLRVADDPGGHVLPAAGDAGSGVLDGGSGDDNLVGGPGADVLDGGFGSDRISGGGGSDTLTNAGRPDGVTVDLAQGLASGPDGERDVLDGIENVTGGEGPDSLSGDDAANTIVGGAGDDTIHGGGAGDELTGDAGADDVSGDAGNDSVFGGDSFAGDESPNKLHGGSGRDAVVGGGRRDVLDGGPDGDWLLGLGGHDEFHARDGDFDWVRCGSVGRSRVLLDVEDYVEHCGRVQRSRPARGIFVTGRLRARSYDLGLACPEDATRGCRGTYRLVFRGGRTHAERWALKAGQSVERYYFRAPITPRERRALRRAPASSLRVRVETRDARGRRTAFSAPFPGASIGGYPDYAYGTRCEECPPDG